MQEPTEAGAEAPIPTVTVSNGPSRPNLNLTVAARRKAAKRTLPWDLAAGELDLMSPQRKKRRVEEPFSASADQAARKTASSDVSVDLPPPVAANDDVNVDPVTDTQPNAVATGATGRWTTDEDAKLTYAVANTPKFKLGNKYMTDWDAVAALVPGRTRKQCFARWTNGIDSSIDGTARRTGKWTTVEDSKLKDAVQMHGAKKWKEIAVLVPGRTKAQCMSRWKNVSDPSIDRATGSKRKWTADEESKLKDAVKRHGGKKWGAIAALVPGRVESQCYKRWHKALIPKIDRANGRTGRWTSDEDNTLKDAVQAHGGKNWGAISALTPGRTASQCMGRWHDVLKPNIGGVSGCAGKWTAVEDNKLKDAVQTHGGKDWVAIASLVPDRRRMQCYGRWHNFLDPSIDRRANELTDKWAEDEESKLKDAVQMHGGTN
jgi:hypothetical protein